METQLTKMIKFKAIKPHQRIRPEICAIELIDLHNSALELNLQKFYETHNRGESHEEFFAKYELLHYLERTGEDTITLKTKIKLKG
jgi:hypothetical protein